MYSLKQLYQIGHGPSSSHTMGPEKAAKSFKKKYPDADAYKVILYGSLALTGEGHGTAAALRAVLPGCEVLCDKVTSGLRHPNTLDLFAYGGGKQLGYCRAYSIGGGTVEIEGEENEAPKRVYPHRSFTEISDYCRADSLRLPDYVRRIEGDAIFERLAKVWQVMQSAVEEGLAAEGFLPGELHIPRKAKYLYELRCHNEGSSTAEDRMVCAYAYAVSEQNAAGGKIVTAPTCGSCGVLPAVLYYMKINKGFTDPEILNALAAAGIIGNVIKTNASVSGAECGCQAEIGSACSMAAAALAELYGMDLGRIEYAAEVAMEHHLGLTCDPVLGLVQIPCIERNAVAAMRAINSVSIANFLSDTRRISFDAVVNTMYETGRDLNIGYRETSTSGLAKLYRQIERNESND